MRAMTRDERDLRAVRAGTLVLYVVWFFICIWDQTILAVGDYSPLAPGYSRFVFVLLGWTLMFIIYRAIFRRWPTMNERQHTLIGLASIFFGLLLVGWCFAASTQLS
jgi:hypothetical protein